jgi:hypothetical protein
MCACVCVYIMRSQTSRARTIITVKRAGVNRIRVYKGRAFKGRYTTKVCADPLTGGRGWGGDHSTIIIIVQQRHNGHDIIRIYNVNARITIIIIIILGTANNSRRRRRTRNSEIGLGPRNNGRAVVNWRIYNNGDVRNALADVRLPPPCKSV